MSDTQTTYRGYVIWPSRWVEGRFLFKHPDLSLADITDGRCGGGTSEQDCRDQIDHQIADAQALSDRDGGRA